jgi:scyllo-inositol 2-dehydrogenase (NADP+)
MTASGIGANSVTYRVGLVGYGLAGESFHAPLIAATPGLDLASVVTSNAERAERARARYPEVEVLERTEELWDQHDLIVVATSNRAHVPVASAALEAGHPVVVDKPLAASAADARRLKEEADARALMLAVFHNRRWDGDFLTLRGLIEDGALGGVQRCSTWGPT